MSETNLTADNATCSSEWCDFCVALDYHDNAGMTPEYIKFSGGEEHARSRELLVTENFRVIVALGPLTQGNLLVLPRTHVVSLAQVDLQDMQELVNIKNRLTVLLREIYGPLILFEHGIARGSFDPNGCIEHAHLQITPCPVNLLGTLKMEFGGFKLEHYELINADNIANRDYLYYGDDADENWLFFVKEMESQFIRKLICKQLGRTNNWNWRSHPKIEIIHETVDTLSDKLRFS